VRPISRLQLQSRINLNANPTPFEAIYKIRTDFIQIPETIEVCCAVYLTSDSNTHCFCATIVNKTGVSDRYVSQTFFDGRLQLLAPTRYESPLHPPGEGRIEEQIHWIFSERTLDY
jgi:hypothetical protein